MFKHKIRVGYSQTDMNKKMTIKAIVDCFQDSSCFHSEEVGRGFDYLEPRNLVWILNFWQIEFTRFPKFAEYITVGTAPYEFKGYFGMRNFWIEDEQGEMIVKANSVWTHMDMKKQFPAKAGQEIIDAYGQGEKIPMNYGPRKIKLPQDDEWSVEKMDEVEIKAYHLDSNHHVNNGQYISIALSFLEDAEYKEIKVEYKKQALLGDVITPFIYRKDNTVIVTLCNAQKEPYAIVQVERVG